MIKALLFTSNNEHKLKEVREILTDRHGIVVYSLKDFKLDIDPDENGDTYLENALIKADETFSIFGKMPIVADDSGLEVECLKRSPGIKSHRYQKQNGGPVNANKTLIKEINRTDKNNRNASFICGIVLMFPNGRYREFTGVCPGKIAEQAEEIEGFGYDPIFIPNGYEETFNELSQEIKNTISHRALALEKMVSYLKTIKE